jgi:hypothetical protein
MKMPHEHLKKVAKYSFSTSGTTVRLGLKKPNPHPKMK